MNAGEVFKQHLDKHPEKFNKMNGLALKVIFEAMNAFAASKLEEVREQAKEKAILAVKGCKIQVVDLDDLNNIFDEILKELK